MLHTQTGGIDMQAIHMKNGIQGYFNTKSKEFHTETRHDDSCHLDDAVHLERMTWGEARMLDADLCGREYPGLSRRNHTHHSIDAYA
jgi:hypothetical protein